MNLRIRFSRTLRRLSGTAAACAAFSVSVLPLFGAGTTGSSVKILIVGDSTVCDYPDTLNCGGWGQYISDFLDSEVTISNRAMPGQSAATFAEKGLWKKAISVKPDVVLIQFGTNDAGDVGYVAGADHLTEFRTYLRRFIKSARLSGARPVLVTPPCRRYFDPAGKIVDLALQAHADAMRQLAELDDVPLVDLSRSSMELFEKLGADSVAGLASAPADKTHFNKVGAKGLAALVMRELPAAAPTLRSHLLAKDSARP